MKTVHVAIIATVTAVAAVYIFTRAARSAADVVGRVVSLDTVSGLAHEVSPLNNDNVFYRSVNAVGAGIVGAPRDSWSLGSWLYDITHPNEKI